MELIISKDYRKYIEENKIQLSDWDKATLIYNHDKASAMEKMESLRELRDNTEDEELKQQITERLDKGYVELKETKAEDVACMWPAWSPEGKAGRNRENQKRFEYRYIDIPLLFKQGDIVTIAGTDIYGIVRNSYQTDGRKLRELEDKRGIFLDYQIYVDTLYEGNEYLPIFSRAFVSPTELEYAEFEDNDSRKYFFEYMNKNLRWDSVIRDYGRKEERMDEVLEKIKMVWKRVPYLSLGQLLIYATEAQDMFWIDDESLMASLERNMENDTP